MKKTELVEKLAAKAEVSKKDAEAMLNAFVETVGEALAEGDSVEVEATAQGKDTEETDEE